MRFIPTAVITLVAVFCCDNWVHLRIYIAQNQARQVAMPQGGFGARDGRAGQLDHLIAG